MTDEQDQLRPPCRLHVIPATEADIAVVFRRGPSKWFHISLWDLNQMELSSGAWLKGKLYPRRANVSPDGRLLGYFALAGKWQSYFAVSKVPWLTALVAWKTDGTYTSGCVFDDQRRLVIYGMISKQEPIQGEYPYPLAFKGLWRWQLTRYINEYLHGWRELTEEYTEERKQWLQDRGIVTFQPHKYPPVILENLDGPPGLTLGVCDTTDGLSVVYEPQKENHYYLAGMDGAAEILAQARWADWDRHGRLLMATEDGRLRVYIIKDRNLSLLWEKDLNPMKPEPKPSPDWARNW